MHHMDQDEAYMTRAFQHIRSLEPRAEFAAQSRRIILVSPRGVRHAPFVHMAPWRRLAFGTVLGGGFILLFLTIGVFSSFHSTEVSNEEKLLTEARAIEFQIRLPEAAYFEESGRAVSVALERLRGNVIQEGIAPQSPASSEKKTTPPSPGSEK